MGNIDTIEIQKNRNKLHRVKKKLKKRFVGIDLVIDEFIQSVEAWYVMPEVITRPTIVNLWGMTGVGKTDLVEEFVKELRLEKNLSKLELGKTGTQGHSVLDLFLSNSNVRSGQQNIIFFDEFQNFRTLSSNGAELEKQGYTDFWELLNRGYMNVNGEVREWIQDFSSDYKQGKKVKETWCGTIEKLEEIKALLSLTESTKDIGNWPVPKMRKILEKYRYKALTKLDCTKSLILIAGNLDEAYRFSGMVDEVDVDADEFHKMSKEISFLDIKKALSKKFRPEQIARLGNTHVIYPCLNTKSYKKLIKLKIKEFEIRVQEVSGVELKIEESVAQAIYDNGVFPTQGARPVFTTLREMLENHIPKVLLFTISDKCKKVELAYGKGILKAKTSKGVLKINHQGKINELKENFTEDEKALIATHEAGHALILSVLFGVAPTKVRLNTVSGGKGGFISLPDLMHTKETISKHLAVALGGFASEKLYFGEEGLTSGSSSDIQKATEIAAKAVRLTGLHSNVPVITFSEGTELGSVSCTDMETTNEKIKVLVGNAEIESLRILKENKELLDKLIKHLIEHEGIAIKDYIKICRENNLQGVKFVEKIEYPYKKMLKSAKVLE